MSELHLIRRSLPDQPELSTAISRAILARAAAGELPPTIRIHRPGREVAFGRQDVAAPGYERAAEAARASGFAAVERLAGGRAALFHEGTIAFARAYPDPEPPRRTYERFEEMAGVVAGALRRLGVDARVGEVPGEYCPGAYSVNARGERKLSGIGQRMISGGAHVGGVVVAAGEDLLARVLDPVYAALGLDWDPASSGSASAERSREVDPDALIEAMIAELAKRHALIESDVDDRTLELARELLERG
ncbi:MAG: lipoate--protein ligase family protein [Solirubrobacterales bacterium]